MIWRKIWRICKMWSVEESDVSHRSYRTTAAWNKNFLFYIVLAAIPVVLFVLMMLATHRR